jgi:maleylpyruvate isomerase
MKLYNYFRSSASYRVRIALQLKALAYDYVAVHIARGEHKDAAFSERSADQLVPMLELPDGRRLSQSMAIIEYLDAVYPTPALLPADAYQRARVQALAQSIACEIHPLNNLRVLKYLVRELKTDEAAKNTWYRHWVRTGLESFERQLVAAAADRKALGLPTGPLCWGDTPTLADCCLVPQIFNARRFDTPLDGLPLTMAAFEAAVAIPAFAAAAPERCPDFEA